MIKKYNELNESDNEFGEITIKIEGNGFIKQMMINDIKRSLRKYMGKRNLYVDNKKINSYK